MSADLHPTLRRQLRRIGIDLSSGEAVPPDVLGRFLARVDRAYRDAEEWRYTLERSMDISAGEMAQLYDELAAASDRLVQGEQSKLDSVIGALDHGVIAVDTTGNVMFANRAAEVLLGGRPTSLPDMIGRFHPHDHGGERVSAHELVQRAAAGEHIFEMGCTLHRVDDSEVEILATLSPIYEGGAVAGGVLAFHDMTEHNETLERLADALRDAHTAVEVKTQFLANMSHEIRTPMNGVIGMLELLAGTQMTSEQRQFADIAKTSGEALLDIINEILDFSKLEAGKVELERSEFSPAAVAEDVVGLLGPTATEHGVLINVLVGTGVARTVVGDGGRVRQVLLNLVGNAVKFTDGGTVTVQVERTVPTMAGTGEMVLRYRVTDTGCGIPESRLADLFAPFSQLDASTTRTHGGTGLGLAISTELVQLMGGEMTVDSEVGAGSTFSFTVPVEEADVPPAPVARPLPGEVLALVVDAQESNRRVAREYLQRMACRVVEADTAVEALIRLQTAAEVGAGFDVVVVDSQIDEVGGLQLAHEIRANPGLADTALVVIHAPQHAGGARDALGAAADTVVLRPLRQDRFEDAVSTSYWSRTDAAAGLTTTAPEAAMSAVDGEVAGHMPLDPAAAPDVTVEEAPPGPRILVAEDNATNQIVIRAFLDRLGLSATIVENGTEAIDAVAADPYDLVLMDCQMPVVDGYDATRAIRALAVEHRSVPILAMTANALEGDRQKCLDAGMDEHLTKPLSIDTLRDMLLQYLPGALGDLPPTQPPAGPALN